MPTINPHINFNGNCEEAFEFYRTTFGGDFVLFNRFGKGDKTTESEIDKIAQIVLPIGSNLLIGNDIPLFMGKVEENENRSKISVSCESKEEALRIFEGLSKGGEVEVDFSNSEFDIYFSMFRDKFGIEWIVSFDLQ